MARRITKEPSIRSKDERRDAEEGKLYWADLTGGLHLGYRRTSRGGKWLARVYLGGQQYRRIKIGTADDTATANGLTVLNYQQAAKLARAQQVEAAQPAGPMTVREAFDQYVEWLLVEKRSPRQSREARTNLDLHVHQKLFDKPVAKLTQTEVEAIKNKLAKLKPEEANDPEVQRRKKATANRVMATVKAALNRVYRNIDNNIPSNAAWRQVENFKNVRGARDVFLDADQQRRLINHCKGAFRNFVTCCLLTGLRPPHEVEALKVRDFDGERLKLTYGKSGGRPIILTDEAIRFFEGLAAGREPDAPLVPRDDGKPWGRNEHLEPMRQAVKRAKLPKETTSYNLRHSYISEACRRGMNTMYIARNVGTSVAMIEKHYHHFLDDSFRQQINAHGPRLNLAKTGTNVVAIAKGRRRA